MTELAPAGMVTHIGTTTSLNDMAPPTPSFAEPTQTRSRPLSEISDNSNSDRRRSFARSLQSKSRPTSEVREFKDDSTGAPRRVASASGSDLRTITLNLNEYASGPSVKSPTGSVASSTSQALPPPSPTTKTLSKPTLPKRPGLIGRISSNGSSKSKEGAVSDGAGLKEAGGSTQRDKLKEEAEDDGDDHISSLLVNKRQSLRPSPLSASYADVTKPIPSPLPSSSSFSSTRSFASSSDLTVPGRPATKSKPSWLRRASGQSVTRAKSKSPANEDINSSTIRNASSTGNSPGGSTFTASSSLPPVLPPREGVTGGDMGPPQMPRRSSYAYATAGSAGSGSSRSQLGEGQGRPAFSPAPPPLPSRENVGNIRTRLAAWTSAAQSTSSFSGFTRSESSSSIASNATSTSTVPSQRVSGSAGRVLGHAGSAVQKGWAGLRARGVTGSISSMSQLATTGRRGSMDPSGSWSSGLNRGTRDRAQGADMEFPLNDGPIFVEGVVLRPPGQRSGRVFGRDLRETGRAWGVYGAGSEEAGLDEYEQRRRACLPAVVIRVVEYLEEWGPKEEGIFRISGRTSHSLRLRKEFDAGADLNLILCHPADLDPHAVSGIFKSYLRELPSPLLTTELTPKFEDWVRLRNRPKGSGGVNVSEERESLSNLLSQLPSAHWFLLADLVKLLELIPKHAATNRMTTNALMLSLGPSLNIPGGVLTEFLERRAELFSTPPPLDSTNPDLIDFGDVDLDIVPSVMPADSEISRSITPLPQRSNESVKTVPLKDHERDAEKKKPQLPKKPSLTRLFGSSAGKVSNSAESSTSARKTVDSQNPGISINTSPPPRVDVPLVLTSPLPSFESESPPQQASSTADSVERLQDDKLAAVQPSFMPNFEPPRTPSTPTPIADRFSSTGTLFPSLRQPKSSASISSGSGNESTNPASVRRRGAPGFFSSSGESDRQSRSYSGQSVVGNAGAGVKRKDEDENVTGAEDEGRVKRLSAGSGVLA